MEQALQAYIDMILESKEYREYARQRDIIRENPELQAQLNDYRIRNYEMQTSRDTVFERIEAFEKEYAGFREQPMVSDFLDAELAFCRMIQKHNSKIMEAIDFD